MEKEIKINVPDGFEIDKQNSTFELIKFKPIAITDKNQEMSDFLRDITKEMIMRVDKYNPHLITFYDKDNNWLFQQNLKKHTLWVNYSLIWSVFETKFGLNYQETKDFISGWVEEHLNWKGLTPIWLDESRFRVVEEHLNWKGLTPAMVSGEGVYRWKNI